MYSGLKFIFLFHPKRNINFARENGIYISYSGKQLISSEDGKFLIPSCQVKIQSYINNLRSDLFPEFPGLVEQTLEPMIAAWERILRTNLKGKDIQVIVKVALITLTPEKPTYQGGSWHIEGMPHERIVASGLHYLTVEGISESYLEFRKPTIVNEENCDYPQSDFQYTEHHYGLTDHFDGLRRR